MPLRRPGTLLAKRRRPQRATIYITQPKNPNEKQVMKTLMALALVAARKINNPSGTFAPRSSYP